MNHLNRPLDDAIVDVRKAEAPSSLVVVCEHASSKIPEYFSDLGLSGEALKSHIAWDLGALPLAERLAKRLDATLIAAKTSRLVYDCNRPPEARDAMPERSEITDIPGNANLSAAQKSDRINTYYEPFRQAVSQAVAELDEPILITVHSFTPIYHGARRDVEIGILHDTDTRLADALLSEADADHIVRRNEPYGPGDGVTHTLKEHALPGGFLNVMLEVRNDLVADDASQSAMADTLSAWIQRALASLEAAAC
ncbi:N-formylglutamate amidohydrolase [uncultured Tateyamaria sp.]|uniref:N-formylglutamate amidohydrolase n=1 Tax=uncultured Tateyamaria sp. TaxID=455651 RepID=UPI0026054755|nr:N-formylglutamate amidohydrolase [uncultured Tateyamaria sp.]